MKGKVIFCTAKPLDETGGRIEKIERKYLLESAPAEISQNYLIAVSDRTSVFQVNGKTYQYDAGDLMFFRPGESVAYRTLRIPPEGTVYRGIEISPAAMGRLSEKMNYKDNAIPCLNKPIISDHKLANEISVMHEDLIKMTGEESDMVLCRLMQFMADHPNAEIMKGSDRPMLRPGLRRVLDHLHLNYGESMNLAGLAEISNLSMPRFCHVFTEKVGISPHAYLIQYRIHQAKSFLLRRTPIAEVASMTGFVDQAHFSRHFKKLTALTPGQYCKVVAKEKVA